MSTSDELLFENEQPRNRDSDGDGVTDAQEALDGTDANDARDSVRHDAPTVGPLGGDPRDGMVATNLDALVTIDVTANAPVGLDVDQALPVGLDGQAIPTQHHYGNADADQMMGTHVDENSPLNMQRSPLGTSTAIPGVTPPSGVELGNRAPHTSLVSDELPEYEEPPDSGGGIIEWVKDLFTPEPKWDPGPLKEFVPPKEPAPPHVPLPPQRGPKMGYVNPDAEGGGAVGEGDVERALTLAGADTDFVRGAGTPNIEDDAPPPLPRELVTDRNPDGDGSEIDTSTVVATPPGGFFTDGVNPDAGFGTGLAPSTGGAGAGDGDSGDGRQSASYSATASDADAAPNDTTSGTSPDGGRSSGIFTVAAEAPRHVDSDGDGVSDAQERFEGTDPNNADDFIRGDVSTAGPTTADPRGDVDGPSVRPDAPVDVLANIPAGLSVDQALPVGLDGAAIPTRHTYGNDDADQLLAGRVDENSPLNMDRSPFATTETHHDGDLLHTAPPGVELNFNAPNNSLVADTDGGTKETPEEKYKRESGFPKYDNAEDIVKNRESNKAVKEAEEWAKKTAPKSMSDPDADGGGTYVPTAEEVEHAVTIAGADTDFVRGYGGTPQIEGDAPPKGGSLVTDPSPDGDQTAVDTSTVVAVPPGGFFTDGVNPDAGFGTGLAPSTGGGAGGDEGGGRQGTDYGATATESTAGVTEPGTISVVGADTGGGGIHSVSDITGLSSGVPTVESIDGSAGRELAESSGDVATPIGIIIPDIDRPLAAEATVPLETPIGIIIPDVGRSLAATGALEALDAPVPLDPVAAAMAPRSELAVEVPTESFEGLTVDDSLAVPDEVDLDDGF